MLGFFNLGPLEVLIIVLVLAFLTLVVGVTLFVIYLVNRKSGDDGEN
ncbi:MAG TPA: hypothetical protein VK395_12655 [Gemmataceae bacterium]|nr:hypothetical protein [Gemmataceae bacterium]